MHSFEYEGVTITLKQPTGRDYLKLERLKLLIGYWNMSQEERQETAPVLLLLHTTTNVEGNLGFPVPYNGNATAETVLQFVDGVLDAPDTLIKEWESAFYTAKSSITGDPDLAPPEAMEKKASKTPISDKNGE